MMELDTVYVVMLHVCVHVRALFKKYKTFSVLIYSYINTSGNWKNENLCGILTFSNFHEC